MKAPLQGDFSLMMLEPLEQRIAPAGVAVSGVSLKFADTTVVPGEAGSVTFTIENTDAAAAYSGKATIRILLSTDTVFGNDFILETLQNVPIKLAADGKLKKTVKFSVCPLELKGVSVPTDGTDYHILVQVLPSGASAGLGASPNTLEYVYQFGDVGNRKGVTLKGLDESGEFYTIGLKGGGTGSVTVGANPMISFTGMTAKSIASSSLLSTPLHDSINRISADAAMKSILFPGASVTGDISLNGGIETLLLGNTGGTGADLVIGGSKPVKSITLGQVKDLNINAAAGITTLQAIDWEAVGADTITAPFLTNLKALGAPKAFIEGDFAASLNLSGSGAPKDVTLSKAEIAGSLTGGTWDINGVNSKTLKIVAEAAGGWKLDAEGSVKDVLLKGSKTVPGLLVGDKSDDGFTLRAKTFGSVVATGAIDAKIVATGADAKTKIAIGDLVTPSFNGAVVEAATGGIKRLTAGEWINGGKLKANWLETLDCDGKNAGKSSDFTAAVEVAGEVSGSLAFGVKTVSVDGALRGSTWEVPNGIQGLVANSFIDTKINAGKISVLQNGLKKGKGDGAVFQNSTVNAESISLIRVSNVDESNTGSVFGVGAGNFVEYQRFKDGVRVAGFGTSTTGAGVAETVGKYQFKVGGPIA